VIVLINICENFQTKRAKRIVNVFNCLKNKGNDVKIISSNFDHGEKKKLVSNNDGEILIPVFSYKSHFSVFRFVNHLWFALCVFFILVRIKNLQAVYTSSIPPELLFAVSLVKIVREKIKVCADVRDIWPDSWPGQTVTLKSTCFKIYANFLNRFSFKRFDEIIIANPEYNEFVSRFNCSGTLATLGYDMERFSKIKERDRVGCVYIGNFNHSFDLRTLAEFIDTQADVRLIGDGPLMAEYRKSFGYAVFHGFVEPDVVPNILSECVYGLLPITGKATLPNKLFDYYACGLNIITNSETAAMFWSNGEYSVIKSDVFLIRHESLRKELFLDYSEVASEIVNIMLR